MNTGEGWSVLQGKQKLQAEGLPAEQIYAGDIVESREVLGRALQGADALVIATSGVPQIKPLSLIGVRQPNCPSTQECFASSVPAMSTCRAGQSAMPYTQVFWKKLLRQEGARPDFTFKKGQYPEQVLASGSLPSPDTVLPHACTPP